MSTTPLGAGLEGAGSAFVVEPPGLLPPAAGALVFDTSGNANTSPSFTTTRRVTDSKPVDATSILRRLQGPSTLSGDVPAFLLSR